MKLEIARGLFLVGALCVASLAAAAWHEPGTQVISPNDKGYSPVASKMRADKVVRPDQDLLLFMFGLLQGKGPQG